MYQVVTTMLPDQTFLIDEAGLTDLRRQGLLAKEPVEVPDPDAAPEPEPEPDADDDPDAAPVDQPPGSKPAKTGRGRRAETE